MLRHFFLGELHVKLNIYTYMYIHTAPMHLPQHGEDENKANV